ncbi:NAD(P)/FAD-dependent oxidoreductase [Pontibacter sp. 13R65]|uniref:NAD(P)/FAD-dependent oxidoreductase n=1 Tax=Pontibacter sp. 13R65 TaxID=3127458 RepID=UPI00301C8B8C
MKDHNNYEVIIIGGSYAGLAAAMALGRSLRRVLVIDGGKPCNRQTPHSHNFLTQDGETPQRIAEKAKAQVLQYDTIQFYDGLAAKGAETEHGFEITTQAGDLFQAKKLLFATGLTDQMPPIEGFAACWGISVLHCPYCHGYEVRNQPIGLIGNGDMGFEFCRLISNWSKQLTLFTNGPATLTQEQRQKLASYQIEVIEKEIGSFDQENGQLQQVVFHDGTRKEVAAVFARPAFAQHCNIPQQMGCELTEQGLLLVDGFGRTTVPGVFAAGDNATMFRSVANAVAEGTKAGAFINKELIEEAF